MTDPTPTPPTAPPAAPPSTASTILVKAQELGGKRFSLSLSDFLVYAALIGLGYWWGIRTCTGMGDTENRQLAGKLTKAEEELQAANLKIGKVETSLKSEQEIKDELTTKNGDLAKTAAELMDKYRLKIDQYSQLRAKFDAVIKGGAAGILPPDLVASKTPECAACKGAIGFGTPAYATCTWADYAALKAGHGGGTLSLKLGVRIDQVTLHQKPKDGTLEAVVGKVYLQDLSGATIAEGELAADSKVFTAPAGFGDLNRRHFYVIGGVSSRDYKLGFATQKGVKPLIWGITVNKGFTGTGQLGIEALLGWQLR